MEEIYFMPKPYKTFEVFGLPLAFGSMGAMRVCYQLLQTPDTQHAVIHILCMHGLK